MFLCNFAPLRRLKFMKFKIKTFLWSITAILIVFVSVIGFLYWQRNHIIEHIAKDKFAHIEKDRNIKISFSQMSLSGLDNLIIESFKIQEPQDTTFLYIDKIDCKLSLLSMLKREVVITNLCINDIRLNVIDEYGNKNFDFLLHSKASENSSSDNVKEKKSIYEKISDYLGKVFDIIPDDLQIRNMEAYLVHNNYKAKFTIPEFNVVENQFNSIAELSCIGNTSQQMKLFGSFESNNHSIKCNICSADNNPLQIPYIDTLYNANVKTDTLNFSFETTEETSDHMQIAGNLGFSGLNVNYWRISDRDLSIGNGSIDYIVNIHNNYFELDSASTVKFNKLQFHPYLKVELQPTLVVTASTNKKEFPSEDLFASIPNGLFMNLDSLQTTGDLDYHFYFHINKDSIDNLCFESELKKHPNFRIVKFGRTDFRTINNTFSYDARDQGTLVRTFKIGPEWNNFRPLDSISPYLQAAVLCSEDGFFYSHKGFYEGAIQYSLAQNIKQRRFARGGSTISMQLVKNVFLNNNKNIMRKLEEIMIVWLIENERLVSKKRMYEIYLNIIEWGPNHRVYGAEEAAQFYFNKHAHQLSVEESIFLATIIPSPKRFMWKFDETHKLRQSMEYYFKLIGGKMFSRNYITSEDYESLSKDKVIVSGQAVNWLPKLKIEPAVADSLSEEEGESLINLEE